ncbi:hypothetical protein HA150_03455 [Prochlorococcus marinus XMU1414]|jgi:integrase|uniref:Integrase n=1 Tax=Prochlorococcus marinus XMU1424 TaxID=2774497 RepID=A0A9D9FZQ9_PROMR|nr:hypothetical protein [Prochlorococcus marinus]MBO8227951.1 hypothetical protein [Prochlorococcus marinus XMU1414]MBW3045463.1 hypothetical protein [Prochlorococcus marinus str. MU1414]MCR8532269.1 hypothetical protein [Prochlorococcus marinus XMU1420]MCR8535797.1 hypothetical protein [Prochlorococcus marinus XMU1424]
MSRKSEIVNKIKSGVNRLTRTSGAADSELNSELVTKNIEEINQKFKERSIRAKIFVKQNYLYIRGTYTDSKGIRKERKIPLRLSTDISNLVSAEARVLQFVEFINKNGFMPDVMMWDTPKVNPVVSAGGRTIGEAIKVFEIDYWKNKKKTPTKEQSFNLIMHYLDKLPQNAELTINFLIDYIINDSEPESKKRDSLAQYFKSLCKVNKIDGIEKLDPFVGCYTPAKRTKKDAEKLLQLMEMVRPNKRYGWTLCSQYVFGTRIGETYSLIPDLETGTASSVCFPKAKPMYIKYPIALTKELAIKWELDNIERVYSFELNNYDPKESKYVTDKLRAWLQPRAKEVGLEGIQPTDIRHDWGVRSIHAEIDPRAAAKSMGHSLKTHYDIYSQTYDQIDAMKQSKKLNK